MTSIIGAICNSGAAVVTVSDRLTADLQMQIPYEMDLPKKETVVEGRALVLVCGMALNADEVASRVEAAIATARTRVKDEHEGNVEGVLAAFRAVRDSRIVQQVIHPLTGVPDIPSWIQVQASASPALAARVAARMEAFQLHITVMLADYAKGSSLIGRERAHLHVVSDMSPTGSYDRLGFCCEGAGAVFAKDVFRERGFKTSMSVDDVARIAVAAKQATERTKMVGPQTDVFVIDATGINPWSEAPQEKPAKPPKKPVVLAETEHEQKPQEEARTGETADKEPIQSGPLNRPGFSGAPVI